MNLQSKIVVITGGSKGLGKGLAEAFVKNGSKVIITSTNYSELEQTAHAIGADGCVIDVTSPVETEALAKQLVDKYGRIDIWINNAGIQIAPSGIEDVSIDKLKKLFYVNYFGYFYGMQSALRLMKTLDSGTIININSTAGLSGKPGLSAYVSSKFALKGLTESVREEIKDTNINLYQIFPGGIQTDIYHEEIPEDIDQYMSIDYAVDKIITNILLEEPDPDYIIRRPSVT